MSRFVARFLTDQDAPAWQRLWERSPRALGQHWHWPAVAAAGVGRPVRLGVFSVAGALLAGIPFVERRRRWRRVLAHPAPASFAGVLAEPEALSREGFLRDVLEVAGEVLRRGASAEILFQPGVTDVRALLWQGWTARPHYNLISPLAGAPPLEQQAENNVRRQARKAREEGLQPAVGGEDLLDGVLALWEVTRRRQRVPPWVRPECYRALLQWLGSGGVDGLRARVHAIVRDGAAEAGALLVADGGRLSYLLGASLRPEEGEGSGAPTLLHAAATEFWRAEGSVPALYDWVGGNTASVVAFKRKFRPQLEVLTVATWRAPWWRL